jgi:adenylosuccinate lyase
LHQVRRSLLNLVQIARCNKTKFENVGYTHTTHTSPTAFGLDLLVFLVLHMNRRLISI